MFFHAFRPYAEAPRATVGRGFGESSGEPLLALEDLDVERGLCRVLERPVVLENLKAPQTPLPLLRRLRERQRTRPHADHAASLSLDDAADDDVRRY